MSVTVLEGKSLELQFQQFKEYAKDITEWSRSQYNEIVDKAAAPLEAAMDEHGIPREQGLARNAIAHALAAALVSYDQGFVAAHALAIGKEIAQTIVNDNDLQDFKKDMYNNWIGSTIAGYAIANNLTREEIKEKVFQAYYSGELIVGLRDPRIDHFFSIKSNLSKFADDLYNKIDGSLSHCFPSGTLISLGHNRHSLIEDLAVGHTVLAYDDLSVRAKKITRIFRGITTEWLILSCGLTVTPGHRFINEYGTFERIEDIVGRAGQIVREDGSLEYVTARRIEYSHETRHLYEEAEEYISVSSSGNALQSQFRRGWRTYNFEVEDLHTYIAGGVRVHNDSLQDYLDLSVMMKNESYVAAAYGAMMDRGWGVHAFASAAWADASFMSQDFAGHLNDMVGAYKDAVNAKDFKTAEAIREGLENLRATGIEPSLAEHQRGLAENLNSASRDAYPGRIAGSENALKGTDKALGEMRGYTGDGTNPSVAGPAAPTGDPMADSAPHSGGEGGLSLNARTTDSESTAPVITVNGSTTLAELPDGTKFVETTGPGKESAAVMKGDDVLALSSTIKLADGTKREEVYTAIPGGGFQSGVTVYSSEGDVLSYTMSVNRLVVSEYRRSNDKSQTWHLYADGGFCGKMFLSMRREVVGFGSMTLTERCRG
ncbi:Hint domain-containing protein [Microvirga sp. 17 mud 1-3]|uniref:Hint domain-containing protein n=1 Tax=Microvirga sp. 17 mud 1-3 TaxID=2082949 RepID=UPI000D6BFCFB|nr:Hint domain-containing protein [Microvirga sp. 17 mud 1-3]AWM87695.1 hypothetical protein C4E04_13775 [Microvirga sp. 17 mud 1-3]